MFSRVSAEVDETTYPALSAGGKFNYCSTGKAPQLNTLLNGGAHFCDIKWVFESSYYNYVTARGRPLCRAVIRRGHIFFTYSSRTTHTTSIQIKLTIF